jgi:hypothetical protein
MLILSFCLELALIDSNAGGNNWGNCTQSGIKESNFPFSSPAKALKIQEQNQKMLFIFAQNPPFFRFSRSGRGSTGLNF